MKRTAMLICFPLMLASYSLADEIRINELQFVGSHNSYKKAMLDEHMTALAARNPEAAASLAYEHIPLAQQLDLGIRKLEIDVFYEPDQDDFVVGHVQIIDMQTHCATLRVCLQQVIAWSENNPTHVPLWISFNAKDSAVEGLPDPHQFDVSAFELLDAVLMDEVGDRLLAPADVLTERGPVWPTLTSARGKMLFVLDEGGVKRSTYLASGHARAMFTTIDPPHPGAAIQVINDPVADFDLIRERVEAGFMVRTRADANTVEARSGQTDRRDRAFASGAQAISTDYYLRTNPFGTDYSVIPQIRCNPVLRPQCELETLVEP